MNVLTSSAALDIAAVRMVVLNEVILNKAETARKPTETYLKKSGRAAFPISRSAYFAVSIRLLSRL